MKIKNGLFVLILLSSVSLFSQDFEVAPVKLNFSVEPGQSKSRIITLKNHSSTNQTFVAVLGDFLPQKDGGNKTLSANSTSFSCADWITISPSFFELAPNEEKELAITMQVPVGNFSSRWAMIYFRTAQEQTTFSADKGLRTGVSVSSQIAVKVIQSPSSNTNYSVKIDKLKEITKENDTARVFSANIENIGDKITNCRVFLIVSNIKTAEEIQFDPVEIQIFPKTLRVVNLRFPKVLPKGDYSLAAVLDYGDKANLEGTQIMIKVE